jgi:anaerobic magnesium-protoporphyrin IX monomethyl ester cyclase
LVQLKAWGTSSDREITVKGRHSQQFYKYADKLLKDEVKLARLARTSSLDPDLESSLRHDIQAARAGLMSSRMEVEA